MKKKRILIDVDAAAQSQKSGIGSYSAGMIASLAKNSPDTDFIGHYFNFLGRTKPELPHAKNINYVESKLFPRKVANAMRRYNIPLPYELLIKMKPTFIVFPNFLIRKTLSRVPYAVTLHDFTYLEHPEYVSKRNQHDLQKLVPAGLKNAQFALAISKTMGVALKRHYPWFNKPIVSGLIPVAQPKTLDPDKTKQILQTIGITKPYILFIGNIEPRKNISGLIDGYTALPSNIRDAYGLVLAGGEGWNNESTVTHIMEAQQNGLDIIKTGYVTDEQRQALYQEARLVALPSFYEGYGIPALEAFANKKPVLLSNIPVLKEIAGDAAIYCDPNRVGDITEKLELIISDEQLRQKLIYEGNEVIASRTWKSFADILMKEIQQITVRDNRQ